MYPTMEKYCTILIINEMAIWWIRNASIRIPLLIFNPEPKLDPHSNVGKFLVKKILKIITIFFQLHLFITVNQQKGSALVTDLSPESSQ